MELSVVECRYCDDFFGILRWDHALKAGALHARVRIEGPDVWHLVSNPGVPGKTTKMLGGLSSYHGCPARE